MTHQEQIAQIEEWKQIVATAEEEVAFFKGRLSSKQEELKTKYRVTTISAANKLNETLATEIAKLDIIIAEGMASIQKELAEDV